MSRKLSTIFKTIIFVLLASTIFSCKIQEDLDTALSCDCSKSMDDGTFNKPHYDDDKIKGLVDTTFGDNGVKAVPVGTNWDHASQLAISSLGQIIGVGASSNGNGVKPTIVALDSNGQLDPRFGIGGVVRGDFGGFPDMLFDVGVQTDGKIISVGSSGNGTFANIALSRRSTSGVLDASFNSDGKILTNIGVASDSASALVIQPDGKIIVGGSSNNGVNKDFALVRYLPDGKLDNSFGGDGKVTTAVGPGDDYIRSIVIQNDGKIVAVGSSSNGNNEDFTIARYNPNGSLDSSFGGTGKVTTAIGDGRDRAFDVAIQADGKIVVVGQYNIGKKYYHAVVRYDVDGSLDNSFANMGVYINASLLGVARAVVIQKNQKILFGGERVSPGTPLVRLESDGTLDLEFGINGVVISDVSGNGINDIIIGTNEKILVLGSDNSNSFTFARFE